MTMTGYDVSNWQSGYDTGWLIDTSDFLIMKATEGLNFVDGYCDGWVQACRNAGHPWGFYHFGRNNNATSEADYFVDNCLNYFGEGIPVLDWEDGQSVDWVNEFVRRVHDRTGVWPWIYANPWRFQLGGVEANCGRWVASYPGGTPDPSECPAADGVAVCAWQYTSTPLDTNYFYGDYAAWAAYARGSKEENDMTPEQSAQLAEVYNQVTRTDDPTGREKLLNDHDHIKWIASVLAGTDDGAPKDIISMLERITCKLNAIEERLDSIDDNLFEDA